jgi:periplasmic protein TonB
MPLRCLLFSSNEEMVQPIWQVLTDLGIEGEYCQSAVDAVERVTTQLFQIVITDWEDQPEAAFLLKTARDLKAAQRPLTLAIVSDGARLPEALQAGANSVLMKPIRAEQVRDTMSTACELLRAKQQPAVPQTAAPMVQREAPETAALAAAASVSAVSAPASVPASVTQAPGQSFRAGEFLQSPGSAPGAQFDTEAGCEVQKSLDQAAAAEVDALTELEPTAAAVEDAPAESAEPAEPVAPQEPLTGWAALQARLTRVAPAPVVDASPKSELLSYGETPSYGAQPAESLAEEGGDQEKEPQPVSGPEAALYAYMSGEPNESAPTEEPRSKRSKIFLVGALAVTCVVLAAAPRARQSLRILYRNGVHAGRNWLNPPPAPLPQAVPLHDSFGQSGDEYNLPVAGNIPDATTDPSQIRVLPVIDPTAKPEKGSEANGGQAKATTGENNPTDPSQTGSNQVGSNQNGSNQTESNQTESNQTGPSQSGQAPVGEGQVKDPASAMVGDVPGKAAEAPPSPVRSAVQAQENAPVVQASTAPPRPVTPVQSPAPPHAVSAGSSAGIPSSLKSQMATMTPEASGAKPDEAAMTSIEPVNLPEPAARGLLAQAVDPEYPAAARASGQRGSVVLQVVIGRDGAVQDAKFLQGSLVFARAAIDAVKQWRFKPYAMNGRTVSVQSVITLNFKPPA